MCLSLKRKRQRLREWTCGYSGWGEGMAGWIGRVALTYVHHHVWDRQLDRSCWPARGAQLRALRCHRGRGWGLCGRSRREGVNGDIQPIHVFVQQKLTECCKATYSPFFKKAIHLKKNIQSAIAHVDTYMMRPGKQCSNHQSVRRKVWEKNVNYLVAQRAKRLPAMRETWVRSLHREDPLEKGMATHSSTFAWKIPRTEEPGRLQSMGSQRVGHNWVTSLTHSPCFVTGWP